ncbi:MAG: hypothetical protein FWE53_05205 [Firmicutes bacterium]|nr:hypothetical protein [Bacillota bacterium]
MDTLLIVIIAVALIDFLLLVVLIAQRQARKRRYRKTLNRETEEFTNRMLNRNEPDINNQMAGDVVISYIDSQKLKKE